MPDPLDAAAPAASLDALTVFVRGLALQAEIGVHAHERGRNQPLIADITLDLDPCPVAGIADTVNYETVASKARALAAGGHIDLVETFAERLAAACLDSPRVQRVRVRIEKPEAISDAEAAGVEITAARG